MEPTLEKSSQKKQVKHLPEDGLSSSLRQILDVLLHLDIPAKGRIAHHVRMGRLHRALVLCGRGQQILWQKAWKRAAVPGILDQLQLLSHVERLLLYESRNVNERNFA